MGRCGLLYLSYLHTGRLYRMVSRYSFLKSAVVSPILSILSINLINRLINPIKKFFDHRKFSVQRGLESLRSAADVLPWCPSSSGSRWTLMPASWNGPATTAPTRIIPPPWSVSCAGPPNGRSTFRWRILKLSVDRNTHLHNAVSC